MNTQFRAPGVSAYLFGYFSLGKWKKNTDSLRSRALDGTTFTVGSVTLRSKMLLSGPLRSPHFPWQVPEPFCKMGLGTCFHPFLPRGRFSAKKGYLIEPDRNSAPRWGIWNCTSGEPLLCRIQVGIDIFQGWGWLCRLRRESRGSRHAEDGAESGERGMQESLTAFFFPRFSRNLAAFLPLFLNQSAMSWSNPQLGLNKLSFLLFQRRVLTGALTNLASQLRQACSGPSHGL